MDETQNSGGGAGPEFTLSWPAGRGPLRVDAPGPVSAGPSGGQPHEILSLDRLAVPGRCDFEAFQLKNIGGVRSDIEGRSARCSRASIVGRTAGAGLRGRSHRDRQSTWKSRRLRRSVGELDGLEVDILSRFRQTGEQAVGLPISYIDARDVAAALSSYDGREPEPMLRQLAIGSRNRPHPPVSHSRAGGRR